MKVEISVSQDELAAVEGDSTNERFYRILAQIEELVDTQEITHLVVNRYLGCLFILFGLVRVHFVDILQVTLVLDGKDVWMPITIRET